MDFWATLEDLPAIEALKISFVVYPLINGLHVIGIGTLVTSVILMDLRILGAFATMEPAAFRGLMRRVAFSGFALAVTTGLPMFAIQASDYVENPAFLTKMGLLAAAGLNFLAFLKVDTDPRTPAVPVRILAAISIALWLGVLFAGRFIGFV